MDCNNCGTVLIKGKKPNKTGLCKACFNRQYKLLNKDKVKESNRLSYQKNKEKTRKRKREYVRNRRSIDLEFRLKENLRTRLSKALTRNQKTGSSVADLGCSIEELKTHIESKFAPGMTWENYGIKGWHIDHIKPLAKFDLKDEVQLKEACHYTNLQPLWWQDNLEKRHVDGSVN